MLTVTCTACGNNKFNKIGTNGVFVNLKCKQCGWKTMFIPPQALPSKQSASSGGTLGSVMSKAKRLRKVRADMDKDEFIHGIHSSKLCECPGCGKKTCYWIGGGPNDIDCLNHACKFYQPKLEEGQQRYQFSSDRPYEEIENDNNDDDEDTKELNIDDFNFGDMGFSD